MSEETQKILKMLEDGKISSQEAEKLLSALRNSEQQMEISNKKRHWLKIRVFEGDTEKPKVKVNLPIVLIKVFLKLGMKFSDKIPKSVQDKLGEKGIPLDFDNLSAEQIEEIFDELSANGPLHLVDVDDDEDKVEIVLE